MDIFYVVQLMAVSNVVSLHAVGSRFPSEFDSRIPDQRFFLHEHLEDVMKMKARPLWVGKKTNENNDEPT